jgi:hypothetical protein
MKKNILLASFFLLALMSAGCSEKSNPLSPGVVLVDNALLGEWYKIESTSGLIRPSTSISGFQINNDGSKIPVAVETSTGKLMLSEFTHIDTVLYAFNGKIILKRFFAPNIFYDTLNYFFKNDSLVFDRGFLQEVYARSSIGAEVAEPLVSELSAEINEFNFENYKIYPSPSAFAGIDLNGTPNKFFIEAISSNHIVIIEIENFTGSGTYNLGGESGNKASVHEIIDDILIIYETGTAHIGTIIIDEYDLQGNRSSGTFSFNCINSFSELLEVKNGNFNLPLYSGS